MHPDPAGVTHLSSETFLPAAYDPADAPKCHSTEEGARGGGGVMRKGLGLSQL